MYLAPRQTNSTGQAACVPDHYTLRVNGHELIANGSDKGEPGDTVVVWPVKGGPRIMRRLARCAPYRDFYFASLNNGRTVAVPVNKVRLIHAVIGGPALSEAR